MFDEEEDSGPTQLVIGFALAVAALVVFGVTCGTVIPAALGTPIGGEGASASAYVGGSADLIDVPMTGRLLGTVYFDLGQAAVSPATGAEVARIAAQIQADPSAIVVLGGYHDPSGDPAQNALLAKNRAAAVRAALNAAGASLSQIVLRRPESTTGDGTAAEARRVEVRWVD